MQSTDARQSTLVIWNWVKNPNAIWSCFAKLIGGFTEANELLSTRICALEDQSAGAARTLPRPENEHHPVSLCFFCLFSRTWRC